MTPSPPEGLEFVHEDADGLIVRFDTNIYPHEAVMKAAHRFTDRCQVHLQPGPDASILCRLIARTGDDGDDLARSFANETLDQALRSRLKAETDTIRRLILAQAFSRTNILHPELDDSQAATSEAEHHT